jgi:hypothetical protein
LSSDGGKELYDFNQDWDEKHNLFDDEKEVAAPIMRKLEDWQSGIWRMPLEKRKRKLDKTTEEALRSLGYIR